MILSDQAERLGETFAQLVIDEDWQGLSELFADACVTADNLAVAFQWRSLSSRLAQAYAEETNVEAEVPDTAQPVDSEVWNDVCRDNDYGPKPVCEIGKCVAADSAGQGPFIEINFIPDPESGLDNCYRCILTIIDGSKPKVSGCEIELILD